MRLLRTSSLFITRDNGGGYWDDKGRWIVATPSAPFSIDCNIQPYREGKTQVVLPEGTSTSAAYVVRTKVDLKTSEQIGEKEVADTTVIDGFVCEAFKDENWSRYGLRTDHHKVVFIRKDQATGGSL